MAFTYDPTTPRGIARMLIPDTTSTSYVFEDDELDALLSLNDTDPRRAAADALDIIATQQTMVLKYVTVNRVTTNGPAVGAELRARAAALRALSREAAADLAVPEVVSQAVDEWTARDLVIREALGL